MRLISELCILKIDKIEAKRTADLEKTARTITKIISKAPKLETVSIERLTSQEFYMFVDVYTLFDLPRSPVHPLRNLALQDMIADLDVLIIFFRRYAGTLVAVTFTRMVCADSPWSTVLERLKALTFPNLRQFRLDHCFEYSINGAPPDVTDVTDYILDRTDHNSQPGS